MKTTLQYVQISSEENPFIFADGNNADPLTLAYETYGTLNENKDNAVLVFHALSGSAHVTGYDEVGSESELWTPENYQGWWGDFVGSGKGIDTDKYFVICANYPGSCYGSTGPSSINPKTGKPYGSQFPNLAISDIVRANARLLDQLGLRNLLAVVGNSLGGFCALDFAVRYPMRVKLVMPVATGIRTTVLSKALNFEQILAIEEDTNYNRGDYYEGQPPNSGLILARIISHKCFVSLSLMESRARKEIIQPDDVLSGYQLQHQIESYLLHQGRKFVSRFDANSYLRIVNAWQSFDLPRDLAGGDAVECFARCKGQSWMVFSISSDVCFYPEEQSEIVNLLKDNQIEHQYITVHSEKGHDSFLLEPELYAPYISYKLDQSHTRLVEENQAPPKPSGDFSI